MVKPIFADKYRKTVRKIARPGRLLALGCALLVTFAALRPGQFIGLWLSPDQQAYLYFRCGEYERAADLFQDSSWRGFSHYRNQNFERAAISWESGRRPADRFAMANALAHGEDYEGAVRVYSQLSSDVGLGTDAAHNLAIVEPLAVGQMKKRGKNSKGSGLKMDDSEAATQEKAEQPVAIPAPLPTDEMWLEQVQANPWMFMQKKFMLEYEREKHASAQ